MLRRPPRTTRTYTLFPYTTLFRSKEPTTLDALPGDVSSEVLLRRPDVLQAEHLLIAENANIGAARAAFFPTISLTGTLGTLSTALSGLFKDGSYTYTGSPGASLPLFDFGRRSGNLEYARASDRKSVVSGKGVAERVE